MQKYGRIHAPSKADYEIQRACSIRSGGSGRKIAATGPTKLSKWRESRRSVEVPVERKEKQKEEKGGRREIQTWYANEASRFPPFLPRRSCEPCNRFYASDRLSRSTMGDREIDLWYGSPWIERWKSVGTSFRRSKIRIFERQRV